MPWLGGVQPVRNDVQATGVTIGSEERSVPVAERRQSEARFGISPRSKAAERTAIVPPSRPRNKTRDADAGMDGSLEDAGSSRPRSIGGRQPLARPGAVRQTRAGHRVGRKLLGPPRAVNPDFSSSGPDDPA